MDIAAIIEQRSLHAAALLLRYVSRQTNPITGAALPQAATAKAPPAPPVI